MAEQNSEAATDKIAAAKKTAPKRAPASRKSAMRKPTTRKPVVKKKPAAAAKAASRKKASEKSPQDFAARIQEAARDAFLASLGFYGMAFDEAQEQFNNLQDQLEERRQKADKLYQQLVSRGKKVEKDTREAIDDLELPGFELESLTDRKRLEEQLAKARERFEELKQSAGFKNAA